MNMTWILVLVIRKNSIEVRNLLPNGVKPLHTGPCHDTIDAVICHDTLGQYVTQWVNMKFNMRVNMRVNMISLWIGKLWWQLINDWLSTSNDMSSILTSWANASERIKNILKKCLLTICNIFSVTHYGSTRIQRVNKTSFTQEFT